MWGIAFRARQFAKGSLWLLPLIGAVFGAVLGSVTVDLQHGQLASIWDYTPNTASTLLSSIVGSTAALIGFVVTVTVLVVQMATGTFSARYMRLWYRDRMLKAALAVLIGTLAFAFQLLRHLGSDVPNLGVTIAGLLLLVGLILFMLYLDRVLHRLRPVAVAALVGEDGRARSSHEAVGGQARRAPTSWRGASGRQRPRSPCAEHPGGLDPGDRQLGPRSLGPQARLPARPAPSVGDFLPSGRRLIEVYGEPPDRSERKLAGMVALGVERTIEQDPASRSGSWST